MKGSTFTVTHGAFRHVGFKVHHPHDHYKFCGYLYIHLEYFEDKAFAESLWLTEGTSYFEGYTSLLSDMPMHGGVTFYMQSLSSPSMKTIEIGCDYNHLDDGGEEIELVLYHLERCINWLHDNYKYGPEYAEASK